MSADPAAQRRAGPDASRVAPDPVSAPVLALIGPTASGKTEIGIRLAEALGAEIVAVDSITIYRGMDVGTAKPTAEQRARVPHHLLDVADPSEPYSVARFQRAARAAIAGIHARRRVPLLVGGSGLYFRAVVDDLVFPPTDAGLRARLGRLPPEDLAARLRDLDPSSAGRIDPANLRRVVRALEVAELTGAPFSEFRASWDRYQSRYDLTVAGLRIDGDALAARVAERTRAMLDGGLVDEVRRLLDRGLRDALTASRAIAYREVVSYLDGAVTLDEVAALISSATRRYARRQMIWFRKDPRVRWIEAGDPDPTARAALAVLSPAKPPRPAPLGGLD